jgi:hypothetical protein
MVDLLAPQTAPGGSPPPLVPGIPAGGGQNLLAPRPSTAPVGGPPINSVQWFTQTRGRPPTEEEIAAGIPDRLRWQEDRPGVEAWDRAQGTGNVTDMFDAKTVNMEGGAQVLRAMGQGLFGLGDELVGAIGGVGGIIRGEGWQPAYDRAVEYERTRLDQYREVNPRAAMALELLGSTPTMLIPGLAASRAATLPGRIAAGAASAGAEGFAYGFGATEGNFGQRLGGGLQATAPAMAVGAALPVVAPAVARGVSAAGRVLNSTGSLIGNGIAAITPRVAVGPPRGPLIPPRTNVDIAGDFNIPLTRGQATGNVSEQAAEQAMLHSGRGDYAAREMGKFMESQNAAVRTAAEQIAVDLSGPWGQIITRRDAGSLAMEAMRAAANERRTAGQMLYARAESLPAFVSDGTVEHIPAIIANKLANTDFIFDPQLHPAAFRALQEIREIGSNFYAGDGRVSLTDLITVRRRLNTLDGSTEADDRALSLVIRAYTEGLEDIRNAGLMTGDPRALAFWRQGDAEWSRLMQLTRPEPGDQVGRIIRTIIEGDRTPEDVANWIFGANAIRPGGNTVGVVRTIRDTLGEDSQEWAAIRSAAFTNLITPRNDAGGLLGPQAIVTNLTGFLNGEGQTLSTMLFSAQERDLLRRFTNTLRLTIPDRRATNYSNSSYGVARTLAPMLSQLSGMFGMQIGGLLGPVGSVAGWLVGAASAPVRNYAAVRRALNPRAAEPLFMDPEATRRALTYITLGASAALTPRLAAADDDPVGDE